MLWEDRTRAGKRLLPKRQQYMKVQNGAERRGNPSLDVVGSGGFNSTYLKAGIPIEGA